MSDLHENCLQFPVDFETKKGHALPIGRLQLGEETVRIFLGPKGLMLLIPRPAMESGHIIICQDYTDGIQFAG